jgi:CRISPR-associated protein Cas1
MDPSRSLGYARSFAQAKILNQANMLTHLARVTGEHWLRDEAARVASYAARVASAPDTRSIMVAEAHAARRYWGSIAALLPGGLGFEGRSHEAGDPVNACLNYGYGVLYAEAFRALVIHGLDPYAGFLHVDRSGSPVLVYDYAEMFRVSLVDRTVVEALLSGWRPRVEETGYLSRETRVELVRALIRALSRRAVDSQGRAEALERHIMLYARRLAQSLRSRTPYNGFVEVMVP